MSISDLISDDFIDFFIAPIFQIDPESGDKNKNRDELLSGILATKIEKAKELLLTTGSKLLNLDINVRILNYLRSKCPENNHFPMSAFKRNLHCICQFIIRNFNGISPELITMLNDISLEYYTNQFRIYSIKIYQKKGSLKEMIDNTEYILEKYTGKIRSMGTSPRGLGMEYHDVHLLGPIINNEVQMHMHFNLNDPQYHDHNNLYITFRGIRKELWNDITSLTINKIVLFLGEFLNQPNLIIQNINISNYFNEISLPDQIVEITESSKSRDISLAYDQLIDLNFQFNSAIFNDIRREINGCYRKHYFAGMYVLIRKLLENLLIDCLRAYYTLQNSDKFWNEHLGRFLVFEMLKKNFNGMKDKLEFKQKVGAFPQTYIDVINEFKEEGNSQGHSLFSISHKKIAEDNKHLLNSLIKSLVEITKRISNFT